MARKENALLSWVFAIAAMASGAAAIVGVIALARLINSDILNWPMLSLIAGGPLCYLFKRLSNEYSGVDNDPHYKENRRPRR